MQLHKLTQWGMKFEKVEEYTPNYLRQELKLLKNVLNIQW